MSEISAEEIKEDNIPSLPDSDDFVRKVMDKIHVLNNILHKY